MHKNMTQAWRVLEFGKEIGIVESHYGYAKKYWAERTKATGYEYELVGIRVEA